MSVLIKNGRVIDPATGLDDILDIFIENGTIQGMEKGLSVSAARTIDAEGLVVVPGLVDMHCHLREPGYEYKEDIESGTKSALAGGFTSVACMANTNPVMDTGAQITFVKSRSAAVGHVHVYPIGAVSQGLKGEQLSEMGDMKNAGAVAVSDDGKPVENPSLMRRALIYANMMQLPLISHAEERRLLDGGTMNEGVTATVMGLRGISNAVEEAMVARDILIAEAEGVPIHIAHLSTRGSVELVRQAKKRGVQVTCETCPHYFSLTEEAVRDYDTNAKMNPPLRTAADVEAIKIGLADGTIDAIATDHAPHHIDDKLCEFEYAANGIIGFETALPLGITHLVRQNILSLPALIQKMTVNPADILRIPKGRIAVDGMADLTIFDASAQYEITKESIKSKAKNTPFIGSKVYGKVLYTIVEGKVTAWE